MMISAVDNTGSVTVSAFNMTVSEDEMYELGGDADKFVFVITKENIASLGGGNLRFKVLNTIFKSATIEKFYPEELEPGSGAEIIRLSDSYPGDWGGTGMIPKSKLEAFGGDVKFTLYIEEAAASGPSDNGGDLKLWYNKIKQGCL